MRHPQVVIFSPDDWIEHQLTPMATDQRWRLRSTRQPATVLELVRATRPTVAILQVDPTADDAQAFQLVADIHCHAPEVALVVVSDVKLPERDQAAWLAASLDLGAHAMLFPPLTRPVLEDLVSGCLTATIRRMGG